MRVTNPCLRGSGMHPMFVVDFDIEVFLKSSLRNMGLVAIGAFVSRCNV